MRKCLLLSVCFIALFGCKWLCDAEKKISEGVTTLIVNRWECKAPEEVFKDIKNIVDIGGVCEQEKEPQGIIGSVVCPMLGPVAAEYFAHKVLPQKIYTVWQCNATLVEGDISKVIVTLCETLFPVSPKQGGKT